MQSIIKEMRKFLKEADELSCQVPRQQMEQWLATMVSVQENNKKIRRKKQAIEKTRKKVQEEKKKLDDDFNVSREKTEKMFRMIHDVVMNENYNLYHMDHLHKNLTQLKKDVGPDTEHNSVYPLIALAEDYIRLRKKLHQLNMEKINESLKSGQ